MVGLETQLRMETIDKMMWSFYTKEYYSAIKKGKLETFMGKQKQLTSETKQTQICKHPIVSLVWETGQVSRVQVYDG